MFVTYTQTAWDILLRSPQNRIEAIRPVVESLGGKIECGYLNLEYCQLVAIIQMPQNADMAALSMAFMAQFAVKAVKTLPLITWEEGIQAMEKARKAAYKPPETNPMITRSD
jgi:uncharacterized protein with GYD domain